MPLGKYVNFGSDVFRDESSLTNLFDILRHDRNPRRPPEEVDNGENILGDIGRDCSLVGPVDDAVKITVRSAQETNRITRLKSLEKCLGYS